jgi:GMC oxidoreductase
VGAGPCGIVTALELADRGWSVLLVESGGTRFSPAAQSLSDSDTVGNDRWHVAKSLSVRRQLGGTSSLWGGRCLPFDWVDFQARPQVPDGAWPIGWEELTAYLQRACDWCICGEASFNAHEIPELRDRELVAGLPDGEVRSSDLERWALPTRFGRVYRRRLRRHRKLTLATDLTCVRIACRADGEVDHLELRALDGRRAVARGRHYVLATGGLEATRLLMVSDDIHPAGIGNHSGHLGRWYMAHVEARVAKAHFTPGREGVIFGHEQTADGVYVRRRFSIAPERQQRDGLLNGVVWIVNPEMGDPGHGSGILSGVYLTLISPLGRFLLAEAIRKEGTKTAAPVSRWLHVRNILRDLSSSARFAVSFTWRRILKPGRKAPGFFVGSAENVYPLHYHGEHAPSWNSRVELSDELDALGMPRLRTRLEYAETDVSNVRSVLERIDRHLRDHGAGYLEYTRDDVEAAVWAYLEGRAGYHQTGTTRMSRLPEDGVVDANLTVHGVDNLSVASTSVLPTSSQANPTLTGIALCVRLADHLSERLSDRGERPAVPSPNTN